jgi:hypothetical protein
MKRSCLIIALLFAVVSAGWANMLVNPGFETSAGWLRSGNVDYYDWAPRSGSSGLVFQSWIASPAGFSQEVAAASGTYTFSIWGCAETNYAQLGTELKLEWLNASGVSIQETTVSNYTLAKDASWHNLFVSGTCTSSDLARVRVSVRASWSIGSGGGISFMLDDADLYSGPYAGTRLSNGSFEYKAGGSWRGGQWNGTRDLWGWGDGGMFGQDWANHSGTSGVAFYSYANDGKSNYTVRFWQNVNPVIPTGTFTYALWINRETSALFSNAVMTIEWFDGTFTNKVQGDSVSNLTVTNDYNWHEYYIEANSTSPALREARISFSVDWTYTVTEPGRATKLDDVRFVQMSYSEMTNSLNTDWCYHNTAGYNARNEQVPGTNVGPFLQVDYSTTSVTFYVLGNSPSQAKYNPPEDNSWEVRTSWQDPGNAFTWTNNWASMTRVGDVVISNTAPFHGAPSVGVKTATLWKLVWPMPKSVGGVLYTNRMQVFYAPFVKVTNGPQETSYRYLLGWNAETNNLGQRLGTDPYNRDYEFVINPIKGVAFTNGGFENPTPFAPNLDNTGWWGLGGAYRESWAARTGGAGGVFPTWDLGAFALYQDVITTGGTYQFSGWIQPQTGAVPVALEIKMEWYDKNGTLVQENKQNLMNGLYEEFEWTRIGVIGNCTATNLDYVRVMLSGWYNDGADGGATMFDDMEFTSVATSLQNTGFETGIWRDIRDWYGNPQWRVMTEAWANLAGSNGLAFHGWWTNEPQYEAKIVQPIVATTGSYVYSAMIKRESGFINLTNMELRLEWYGGNYPAKVQADTVVNIAPPSDGSWNQYTVTGTCNNTSIRFVQPVVFAQWAANPEASGRTIQIDETALVYTNLGGESYTDGIPDSWWAQYSILGGDRTATGDYDNDGYLNIEEYAGQTDPSDILDFFPEAAVAQSEVKAVISLVVNPTSAQRLYDAYWKTNLMDYATPWQSYGLSVTGHGGSITLTVTNNDIGGKKFFRTGATLLP